MSSHFTLAPGSEQATRLSGDSRSRDCAVIGLADLRGVTPRAVYLLVIARGKHGESASVFTFGQQIRQALHWGTTSFQCARDLLIKQGALECVGRRGARGPHLFRFGRGRRP